MVAHMLVPIFDLFNRDMTTRATAVCGHFEKAVHPVGSPLTPLETPWDSD